MHSPQPLRQKLRVAVTRRLPEAVETRMKELFDVVLRDDDRKLSREELASAMQNADVIVPTVTDQIDANLLAQAGERLKLPITAQGSITSMSRRPDSAAFWSAIRRGWSPKTPPT